MSNDIEKVTEVVVATVIVAPVSVVVGTAKGIGSAIGKLTRWLY